MGTSSWELEQAPTDAGTCAGGSTLCTHYPAQQWLCACYTELLLARAQLDLARFPLGSMLVKLWRTTLLALHEWLQCPRLSVSISCQRGGSDAGLRVSWMVPPKQSPMKFMGLCEPGGNSKTTRSVTSWWFVQVEK